MSKVCAAGAITSFEGFAPESCSRSAIVFPFAEGNSAAAGAGREESSELPQPTTAAAARQRDRAKRRRRLLTLRHATRPASGTALRNLGKRNGLYSRTPGRSRSVNSAPYDAAAAVGDQGLSVQSK